MTSFVPGPTYDEMLKPWTLPAEVRQRAAVAALAGNELHPANLFNIHWYTGEGDRPSVRKIVLPPALTGVSCNIVVLLADGFPSGKRGLAPTGTVPITEFRLSPEFVDGDCPSPSREMPVPCCQPRHLCPSALMGAAYSILAEAEVDNRIRPGMRVIAVGPVESVIAAAYVSRLKGYPTAAIVPDNLSDAGYQAMLATGAELQIIPGEPCGAAVALDHARRIEEDAASFLLSPYEDLAGYRFHRHVTGTAAIEACKNLGDGRIAAFVSAPDSAGALAAGDQIRQHFPDCTVVAAEMRQGGSWQKGTGSEPDSVGVVEDGTRRGACPLLPRHAANTREPNEIDAAGETVVSLIHNVLTTDYVAMIESKACRRGLSVLLDGSDSLQLRCRLDPATCAALRNSLGMTGVCNLIAAIQTARKLDMPVDTNVVTIASGTLDCHPSAQADPVTTTDAPLDQNRMAAWYQEVFLGPGGAQFLVVGTHSEKDRLSEAKRSFWTRFGYPDTLFDSMMRQSFWETEYEKLFICNERIRRYRKEHGGLELA